MAFVSDSKAPSGVMQVVSSFMSVKVGFGHQGLRSLQVLLPDGLEEIFYFQSFEDFWNCR